MSSDLHTQATAWVHTHAHTDTLIKLKGLVVVKSDTQGIKVKGQGQLTPTEAELKAALLWEASPVSSGPQAGKEGFSGDGWQDFLSVTKASHTQGWQAS